MKRRDSECHGVPHASARTNGTRPDDVRAFGYILFEALMALSLLSMSLIVIHNGLRQTILVREQARDYTQARFLLENVMAKVELQPLLTQATDSGGFQGELSRFHWTWKVSKVDIPPPPFPSNLPQEVIARFKLNVQY
ncbi:MAG: hypothetical protein NTU83_06820, partial [Candidatus Hydrogenedentes bacterium]|nr:hypothetical protein [Candidatus Hydrogenedentota bacterium]